VRMQTIRPNAFALYSPKQAIATLSSMVPRGGCAVEAFDRAHQIHVRAEPLPGLGSRRVYGLAAVQAEELAENVMADLGASEREGVAVAKQPKERQVSGLDEGHERRDPAVALDDDLPPSGTLGLELVRLLLQDQFHHVPVGVRKFDAGV